MAVALASRDVHAHDVGVSATPTRRRFTVAYKRKILEDAAACTRPGELSQDDHAA